MIGDSAGLVRDTAGWVQRGVLCCHHPRHQAGVEDGKYNLFIPAIEASNEDLSWFGRNFTFYLLA